MTDRHQRLCDVCGGLDDHPRHVTALAAAAPDAVPTDEFLDALPDGLPARAIAELLDPITYVRHIDCCASKGCNDCATTLARHGNASGDALLAAILSENGAD